MYWNSVVPNPLGLLSFKGMTCEETQVHTEECQGWSYAALGQDHWNLGDWPGQVLPSSLQREHGPMDTVITSFWPPDCETVNFCCSKPFHL